MACAGPGHQQCIRRPAAEGGNLCHVQARCRDAAIWIKRHSAARERPEALRPTSCCSAPDCCHRRARGSRAQHETCRCLALDMPTCQMTSKHCMVHRMVLTSCWKLWLHGWVSLDSHGPACSRKLLPRLCSDYSHTLECPHEGSLLHLGTFRPVLGKSESGRSPAHDGSAHASRT